MKKKQIILLAVCVAVLLAGIGMKAFFDRNILVAGNVISRDSTAVDLRGKSVEQTHV